MSVEELYKALKIFNREDLTYENDKFFNDFEEYMNTMEQEKVIEVFMSTKDMIKCSKLEQEIDKLVDTNEDINREFSQYKYESKKEIERLNNIINKAIDFLKENACIDKDVEYFCDDLRYDDCKKLLDILKGEDK